MKIRNGFVSNSSSSSFIIVVDIDDLDEHTIREKLFGDQRSVHREYFGEMDCQSIANILVRDVREAYHDMKIGSEQQSELLADMTDHMSDYRKYEMLSDAYPDDWKVVHTKYQEYTDGVMEQAKIKLAEIEKANPGKKIVSVEFSDNDGSYYAYLEHGSLVEKVWPDAIKVSKH